MESLTDQLERVATGYLEEIDALGGALAAIEAGYQQRQIQESAYRRQRAVESGEEVVVGVNRFVDEPTPAPTLQRIDPQEERRQVERVRRVRAERDPIAWERALDRLAAVAGSEENVVPALIDAVHAHATLGEMSDVLRAAWGEHRESITI